MERSSARSRRSRRDWVVDWLLFLAALVYGFAWAIYLHEEPDVAARYLAIDQVIGAVGCLALWFRRRWPLAVALVLIPLSAYGDLVDGAMFVALLTVAIHRRVVITAAVAGLYVVAMGVHIMIRTRIDPPDEPLTPWLSYTLVLVLAVIGWGLFIRNRRELVRSLEERAVRAEAETRLRTERSQLQVREDIAREMHDVLGHRLSLLSVHAGALEYRPDAPPEEIGQAAAVIRGSAHQALQDLREVIGVLRAPVGELPQPTWADLTTLVDESRTAGMIVTWRDDVVAMPPDLVGRTAYRVVQEGLTNVRKHAPDAEVELSVSGGPGRGLSVEILNTSGGRLSATEPGQGLIGLTERVALAAGTIDHGRTDTGGYRLAVSLPWPS